MISRPSFSIYNASAGAGKTHTLVKEYLKILLLDPQDDAYKKILAITFTNKAVAEMKTRVVDCLHNFSQANVSGKYQAMLDQVMQETDLKQEFICQKSHRIIRSIIHNYASFDISTIDKFTHKVIRSFAFDLGLPITFEVSLDADELLQEAVDAVIAKAGEDPSITRLLVDFSLSKANEDRSWDVTRELKDIGGLLLNENNRKEVELFQDISLEEFAKIKKTLEQQIKLLTQNSITLAQSVMDIIAHNNMDEKSFSSQYFPKHVKSIIADAFVSKNKKYLVVEDIKINKKALDKEVIEGYLDQFISIMAQVYQALETRAFYQAFLKNLTPLSLLNTLAVELSVLEKEKNIVSIGKFNAIIHDQIQDQPAPFIYERLGERYTHFFIDEFQDTSEMQWLNLIPLIDNALAGQDLSGTKGTLMIVGDPKQSIYRWRGGKAEQFIALSKQENPFSNPDKQSLDLDTNYRSYKNVIEFNNAFFKSVSAEFDHLDYRDLYENHSAQKVNSKSGGYVELQFLEQNDQQEEPGNVDQELDKSKERQYAVATQQIIENVLAQGFELNDIVILTRKRNHGIYLANFLTEQNIPILSSDSLLINNAEEVRLIIDVLRYLKNPQDREAMLSILYFVGKTKGLEDLTHDFIVEGLAKDNEVGFQQWLEQQGISIEFKVCRAKSLYAAVEAIVNAFMPGKANNAYVLYFLDLVLDKSLKSQFGIADFIAYWNLNFSKFSIPTPEGENAVQIMTIHKSKGLEFPVVIFPFADEDRSKAMRDKLWIDLEPQHQAIALPKALVDPRKEVVNYSQRAEQLYLAKEQEVLLDLINVLYVALTRAEEQLYIISYHNVSSKGEFTNHVSSFFLKFLVEQGLYNPAQLTYSFGKQMRCSSKEEQVNEHVHGRITPVEKALDFDAIKIAQKEALMWDSKAQASVEYGNLVHKILSFVKTKDDVFKAVEQALEYGYIQQKDKQTFERIILSIVSHEELVEFFKVDNKVYNERVIISSEYRNIIPDRVVFQGNDALILDYKTGTMEADYTDQILSYGAAIEEMGYRVVKKVLLFISDDLNIIHL